MKHQLKVINYSHILEFLPLDCLLILDDLQNAHYACHRSSDACCGHALGPAPVCHAILIRLGTGQSHTYRYVLCD